MFKNLANFSCKRNWKEAIGFYLAYFLLDIVFLLLLAVIDVALFGVTAKTFSQGFVQGFHQGFRMGAWVRPMVTIIFCLTISGLLLKEKKLFKNFGYILLALLSGTLAAFGGSLLGLIIPAFITTSGASIVEN